MSQTSLSRIRRILAAGALTVPFLVVLLSWWVLRPALPPMLASHWSDTGPADGTMSTGSMLAMGLVISGIGAVAGWVAVARPGATAAYRRRLWFFAGVPAGLGAAAWLSSALLTVQAGDPYEAVIGGWLVAILASCLYGVIPMAIDAQPRRAQRAQGAGFSGEVRAGAPTALGTVDVDSGFEDDLDEGGNSADTDEEWSTELTSRMFFWLAVALAVLGIALYVVPALSGTAAGDVLDGNGSLIAVVLVVLGIGIMVAFVRTRVVIDRRGFRLESVFFRIPLKRLASSQITAVEEAFIRPGEWGGWGYRVMIGRSAFVLRAGPGIVITTDGGRLFAVTIPDAGCAAAALSDAVRRSSASGAV